MRYIIVIFLAVFSCTLKPKESKAPADLIPQDSMIFLVHDLSILESHIQQKYIQLERYAKIMRMTGDSLLSQHGISRKRYESSLMYYSENPALLNGIYDSVLMRLEGSSAINDVPKIIE